MTKLKYVNYYIGFKELPNESSLLVEISNCGSNCKSCHSPHLRDDIGTDLNYIYPIIHMYRRSITAICFLGHGDVTQQDQFVSVLDRITQMYPELKIGLYSGQNIMEPLFMPYLDYYKVGEYLREFGGLDSPITNQHMYRLIDGEVVEEIYYV